MRLIIKHSAITINIYTVIHKKRGSTFVIITLEKLDLIFIIFALL